MRARALRGGPRAVGAACVLRLRLCVVVLLRLARQQQRLRTEKPGTPIKLRKHIHLSQHSNRTMRHHVSDNHFEGTQEGHTLERHTQRLQAHEPGVAPFRACHLSEALVQDPPHGAGPDEAHEAAIRARLHQRRGDELRPTHHARTRGRERARKQLCTWGPINTFSCGQTREPELQITQHSSSSSSNHDASASSSSSSSSDREGRLPCAC